MQEPREPSEFFALCAGLGFPKVEPVASLRSIAQMFGSSKSRCGIYLLVFSGDRVYVGQAVEVVRRFSQHRKVYDDIVGFSFMPTRHERLDETEKKLIQQAERLGLLVLNTVHASHVVGDTDLDAVFSRDAQQAWLAAPAAYNRLECALSQTLPATQYLRFEKRFHQLQQLPEHTAVLDLLSAYVGSAIPSPRLTEYSFWAVSCLPGTSSHQWPRFACVSVGVMEVFVLGYLRDLPRQSLDMWGFVNVASDCLFAHFSDQEAFLAAFPEVEITPCSYRDAGQYQVRLETLGAQSLARLLQHPAVQMAAATLALRVMRKRATIYGKYHCKQLADAIFERIAVPSICPICV